MNYSRQSMVRGPTQESETLRLLRNKFHNYSKSQQISGARPLVEHSMKSTYKENEGLGWRQTMKSPAKIDQKYTLPGKYSITQNANNQVESDFTKKARELLAKSLSKKLQSPNQFLNPKTVAGPSKPKILEKSILNSPNKTRFQTPHDHRKRRLR